MTTLGVDYSFGRPGGAALAKAGVTFACRYLEYSHAPGSSAGKFLTTAEVADLHTHNVNVVACFESTSQRALTGRQAGLADGTDALVALQGLGFPSECPVYFAVDFDATTAQQAAIDAYLGGCAVPLGRQRVGVYGGYGVMVRCATNHTATWFWQTLAWSAGKQYVGNHLYQYQTGSTGAKPINGAAVDYDRAMQAGYGQWAAPTLPPTDTGGAMILPTDFIGDTADIASGGAVYDEAGKLLQANWSGGSGVPAIRLERQRPAGAALVPIRFGAGVGMVGADKVTAWHIAGEAKLAAGRYLV